jgi:hypothetical protein
MDLMDIANTITQLNNQNALAWNGSLSAEEQVAVLEAAEEVACPFEVGAWITPKEGTDLEGAGKPWRVVSSLPFSLTSEGNIDRRMHPYNMIIATVLRAGEVAYYMGYSPDYERWYNA